MNGSPVRDLAVLIIMFGTAFFLFLGRLPLLDPDEGRYAEIPREMLELGDFITPHLDYVKYFEKPPLHYWLNALSFSLFGQNEFAARFPAALLGLCGILLVYHVGRKLFGRREGLYAALVLGTSIGYQVQARMNIIDMTLTFCMTASLGFILLAMQDGERRKGLYYHLFYLFAALAVLAKGLIGIVLPGMIIFLFLLLTKRWKLVREMRLVTGIPLFFLVCAPWFILVSSRNPEFAQFFFIREHFQRFLTNVHGRYKPPWFFIPVLLGCMIPWIFFLPEAGKELWKGRNLQKIFLALWAAVIFVFFSLSNSKLVPYILPVFPAVALLIGCTLSDFIERDGKPLRKMIYPAVATLGIAGITAIFYPWHFLHPVVSLPGGVIIGILFLTEALLILNFTNRDKRITLIVTTCLFSYLISIVGPHFVLENLATREALLKSSKIVSSEGKDAIISCWGRYQQSLPFYTKRRVVLVGDRNELEMGSLVGDNSKWFVSYSEFEKLWNSSAKVMVLIRSDDIKSMELTVKKPVTILYQGAKNSLIANQGLKENQI